MMNSTKSNYRLLISGALFNFLIYYGGRQIAKGAPHFSLAGPFDNVIPLLSWTILFYYGAYLFWIVNYVLSVVYDRSRYHRFITAHFIGESVCFLMFILFPTAMERPEVTGSSIFDQLLRMTYLWDSPDNLMPSIHCFVSWLSWIGVRKNPFIPRWYQNASLLTAAAICLSTLTVKQHVTADVFAGILLAESSYYAAGYRRCYYECSSDLGC